MKAVILAAGRGSRMKGLTGDRPKCLTVLAGRTLLDWQIDALRRAGVNQIAVVRGYRGDMLAGPYASFDNPRWAETNMVVSLTCAAEPLRAAPCIVSYSDIVYRPEIVSALAASDDEIAITYDRQWRTLWEARFADPLADAETFRASADGSLVEIGARTDRLDDIQGQYMGLLKLTPRGWALIEDHLASLSAEERDRLDMTSLLSRLLDRGIRIGTVPVDGGWCEVDSESDLQLYESLLENQPDWPHRWTDLAQTAGQARAR